MINYPNLGSSIHLHATQSTQRQNNKKYNTAVYTPFDRVVLEYIA